MFSLETSETGGTVGAVASIEPQVLVERDRYHPRQSMAAIVGEVTLKFITHHMGN